MSFFGPFEFITNHLVVACIVFVALFLAICSLFAGARLGAMLGGLLRTIASLVSGPIVYLRRSIEELADFGKVGDKLLENTDQYLISKVLLILRAVTVVASVGVLTASLVLGWYAMLPPEYLRERIDTVSKDIDQKTTELNAASAKLAQMDSDWQGKRSALVDQRKNELTQAAQSASKSRDEITQRIQSEGQATTALNYINNFLETGNYYYRTIEQRRDEVQQEITRSDLPQNAKAELSDYVNKWYEAQKAQHDLTLLSEDSARSAVQPDWQSTKQSVDQLKREIPIFQEELAELRAQAKYHPEELAKFALYGFLEFLAVIWAWGLLYEVASLAVYMAGDVKRIRQKVDVDSPVESAMVVGSGQ